MTVFATHDDEDEVAIVIGIRDKNIPAADFNDYVWGVTVANGWSNRLTRPERTGAGTAQDSTKLDADGSPPHELFLKVGDMVEISSPGIGKLADRVG